MGLRVQEDAMWLVRHVAGVLPAVQRRDGDLARQLRRAVASVPMNIAEGVGSRGGNKQVRFHTALGSAEEVRAGLEVAAVLGYVEGIGPEAADRLDRLVRTLNRLAHR